MSEQNTPTPSPKNIAEGLMMENMALQKMIAYKEQRIQELEAENSALKKWKENSNAIHEYLGKLESPSDNTHSSAPTISNQPIPSLNTPNQ